MFKYLRALVVMAVFVAAPFGDTAARFAIWIKERQMEDQDDWSLSWLAFIAVCVIGSLVFWLAT